MFAGRPSVMTPEAAAAILNVSVFASRAEVAEAFLRRARLTHPDRFAGAPASDLTAAAAEFVRVSAARELLLTRAAVTAATTSRQATARMAASVPSVAGARQRALFDSWPMPRASHVWVA